VSHGRSARDRCRKDKDRKAGACGLWRHSMPARTSNKPSAPCCAPVPGCPSPTRTAANPSAGSPTWTSCAPITHASNKESTKHHNSEAPDLPTRARRRPAAHCGTPPATALNRPPAPPRQRRLRTRVHRANRPGRPPNRPRPGRAADELGTGNSAALARSREAGRSFRAAPRSVLS